MGIFVAAAAARGGRPGGRRQPGEQREAGGVAHRVVEQLAGDFVVRTRFFLSRL